MKTTTPKIANENNNNKNSNNTNSITNATTNNTTTTNNNNNTINNTHRHTFDKQSQLFSLQIDQVQILGIKESTLL